MNCAYRLAALLASYTVEPGHPPEKARGFRNINDLDAWREHAEAADAVRAVDHTLQGMNAAGVNVEPFKVALPRWYAGVHFAITPWGTTPQGNAPRPACTQGDLNLLQALGLVLDTTKPLTLAEDDRRTISDVLAEARGLLEEESDELSDDVRHYLWSLIVRAEMVIGDIEKYGTDTVRQVAFELGGAMTVQSARAKAEGRQEAAHRWGATAWHLMVTCMASVTVGAAGDIAAAPVIKMLTGGN